MRSAGLIAVLSFAASVCAQAVPIGKGPAEAAPSGCSTTAKANFTIGYEPVPGSKKRDTAADDTNLQCTLKNGVLSDTFNRIGSVVSNRQFQFDGPPQAGAIYTGGFAVCDNTSLAIGGTTRWWKCGSGEFYNLYDQWIGGQCDEIRIVITYVDLPSSSSSASSATITSRATISASTSGASLTSSMSVTPIRSVNGTINTSISSVYVSTMTSRATTTGATRSSGVPAAPPSSSSAAAADLAPALAAVAGLFGAALIL